MWYKRLRKPWQNLESSQHRAKDTKLTIVVREQSRESSYFEIYRSLEAYGAYFQLQHHAKTILYSIFNILQYLFNIELILSINAALY